jgi:hypothetical protein
MSKETTVLPNARQDKLLEQAVGDELVVYDQERHRAHRLNRTAALVWRHCDGQTSILDMVALLQSKTHLPADKELVWLALARLEQAHLLQERVMLPADTARVSRRKFIEKLGLATGFALLLPVVESIVAPTSAIAKYATRKCGCKCRCKDGRNTSFSASSQSACASQCAGFCGGSRFTSSCT